MAIAMATEPKFSRSRRPEGLAPEDWQRALRRQFGRDRNFLIENLGTTRCFPSSA